MREEPLKIGEMGISNRLDETGNRGSGSREAVNYEFMVIRANCHQLGVPREGRWNGGGGEGKIGVLLGENTGRLEALEKGRGPREQGLSIKGVPPV